MFKEFYESNLDFEMYYKKEGKLKPLKATEIAANSLMVIDSNEIYCLKRVEKFEMNKAVYVHAFSMREIIPENYEVLYYIVSKDGYASVDNHLDSVDLRTDMLLPGFNNKQIPKVVKSRAVMKLLGLLVILIVPIAIFISFLFEPEPRSNELYFLAELPLFLSFATIPSIIKQIKVLREDKEFEEEYFDTMARINYGSLAQEGEIDKVVYETATHSKLQFYKQQDESFFRKISPFPLKIVKFQLK